MDVSKIYNANVYLDGSNNLLGHASQITLPDVTAVTEDHQALGMIGKVDFVMGVDKLTAKITWNGFYPEHIEGADFLTARKLQVRASIQRLGPDGLQSEVPLVTTLVAAWRKVPLGAFAAATAVTFEDELSVSYIKIEVDGDEWLEFDALNNIWRVRKKDVLAAYRANIGG